MWRTAILRALTEMHTVGPGAVRRAFRLSLAIAIIRCKFLVMRLFSRPGGRQIRGSYDDFTSQYKLIACRCSLLNLPVGQGATVYFSYSC